MNNLSSQVRKHPQLLSFKQMIFRGSALLLLLAMLSICFTVGALMSGSIIDKTAPQAKSGLLDLTQLDLAASSSVALDGQWDFYWQQLITPKDVAIEPRHVSHIKVPSVWTETPIQGQTLPAQGYASYQLKVKTDQIFSQLALSIPKIGTAYTLYINNEIVARAGQVSDTAGQSEPGYNPQTVFFTPKSDSFVITLQVSNYQLKWGGIWSSLRLGTVNAINQDLTRHVLRYTFFIALFLTVASYNLTQFLLHPKDPLPGLIAIGCMLLALREAELSQILHQADLLSWSFKSNVRIDFMTFYLAVPVMSAYFHLCFLQDYHKRVMQLIYVVSVGFALLTLFSSTLVASASLIGYQIFVLLIMPYIIWRLFRAVRKRRKGAKLLMVGTLVLFVLTTNDILYSQGLIESLPMVSFGLVAFILCQNYLTYMRFINTDRKNQVLTVTLDQRNNQLEEFSSSLEHQVSQRTHALAEANEQLEELAHKDSLTGLANRRGMMFDVEDALVQYQQKDIPFCFLLIDFDKFKHINDLLGHDVGDKVLVQGAQIIQTNLRNQDRVARWGGEEFLILLPGSHTDGAKIVAEKIRTKVRDALTASLQHPVSVTIGIAEFAADDTINSCLKKADTALYRGKESGRDRVEIATAAPST